MKIEDLQATAQLAHLNMGEAELAAAFPAFEQMLGFFAAMQAADNDAAAFPAGFAGDAAHIDSSALVASSAHFRPDGPAYHAHNSPNAGSIGANDDALVSSLLNNAGDRDGRFIVVPNVL
jgi:aspartyl-tRNA(Asn)/glutamyl-tRNA(Gln) amidotransferase subunit C